MNNFPKRGEVYWVSLDPTIGSEVRKTRPGLILSNNSANKYSDRVIIGPITSSIKRLYPFEAQVRSPHGDNKVMLDHIRSVDKKRLGSKIYSISELEMREVERALKLALAIP